MNLTKQEQEAYEGKFGPAMEWGMRFLVDLGDALGAERLLDISSAAIGWAPRFKDLLSPEVFSDILSKGLRVPTYGLEIGVERQYWEDLGIPKQEVEDQKSMDQRAKDIGLSLLSTCTPYTVGYLPTRGSHCAVIENSLIVFVNSVLGARTLRHSSHSVIASAITGKSPAANFHLEERRRGQILIEVDADLEDVTDYDLLGYYVGQQVGIDVPVFVGHKSPRLEDLKAVCSAISTSGGVGLFHMVGATPEAPTREAAFGNEKPKDVVNVSRRELDETRNSLCTGGSRKIDLIVLGCPHYTIKEVENLGRFLEGRRVHRNVNLWVFTPFATRYITDLMGVTRLIEGAGARVLSDTCPFLDGRVS